MKALRQLLDKTQQKQQWKGSVYPNQCTSGNCHD